MVVPDAAFERGQTQQIRDELRRRLDRLPYEIWLNLELTPHDAAPSGP